MKRLLSLVLSVVLLVGLVAVPVSAESNLTPSEEMIALLKEFEGFDRYPRWDYQQWTIGYGSACPEEDRERYNANGITEAEADELLREHMATFIKSLNSFDDKYSLNLTQNEFDALLLFTYNMGHGWMFKEGSFRAAVISGITGNDLLFPMGQWCHAGGEILTQLVRRRLMEYNMYVNGVYSRTAPANLCYVILDANGGTGDTDIQCYDSNLTDGIRVTPTREGYTFAGWYTAKTGGAKVTVLDASVGSCTLYARWTEGGADVPEEPEEPEETQPAMDPVTVTVTATHVNIRKGPGTNYGTNGQVNTGDVLTITEVQEGSSYTWGKFSKGWVALMYTNYDEVVNPPATEPPATEPPATEPPATEPPATEPPATEPPATEPEEPAAPAVMGTVTGNSLRIRTGAGTNYDVVGFLNTGDRVEILETKQVGSMTWGRISKGWISMTYVKLDAAEEDAPAEEPQEPEKPEEPNEPEVPSVSTVMGTVNANSLRIRTGAGTGYDVVGFLNTGDRVEIMETKTVNGMTWGRISKGWISLSYVDLDKNGDQNATTVTMTVDTSCLRIRSGAGTTNTVVGYLYRGEKVEILETKTVDGMTWGRITKGWVSMDYLK